MRALIQRVSRAAVTVGERRAAIGPGLVILLGVRRGDTPEAADWTARKCAGLRIFEDDEGKMNRSLLDVGGCALVVSQFTLYGDADRGRRPSFTEAAPPEEAVPLYERFVAALRAEGVPRVETGVFQAMMSVELVNEGPVTILVESRSAAGADTASADYAVRGANVASAGSAVRDAATAEARDFGRLFHPDAEPLVLASASPRRSELLERAGIPHIVAPVAADETMRPGAAPRDEAERLAREKAVAAAPLWPGRTVLAADTIVDLAGQPLNKPENDADAARMLAALSGRTHGVHTGIALAVGGSGILRSAVVTTLVTFRALSSAEIAAYVASGEPRDKAGAYGIQGLAGLFVERIDGSYDNVVGLPLAHLATLLRSAERITP
jgi:MAF protein/D-tyrosyl-tRNA(Tyr) deacylase